MRKQFNTSSSVRLWRAGDLRLRRMPLRYLLFIFLIASCDNSTDPSSPQVCQDIPQQDQIGLIVPGSRFGDAKLSPDGKTIAYSITPLYDLFFYDIETGKQTKLPPPKLPDSIQFVHMGYFQWCPYDPNMLVIDAWTRTDTSGNWSKYFFAANSYIVKRDGAVIRRVTPPNLPFWGTAGGLHTYSWLPGSTPEIDSLIIFSNERGSELILPQENKALLPPYLPLYFSLKGYNWYGRSVGSLPIKVNGLPLHFEGFPGLWYQKANWSPSGKYLAIGGYTTPEQESLETPNLWVLDIETWLQNPSKPAPIVLSVNFQQRYCMYTLSADPVFLSESTLAVSMFPAYAAYAHYYEIDLEGNLIRQISQDL